MRRLLRIPEPDLLFGHSQSVTDPRDGLALFGPLDAGKPYGIRAAVVGTTNGIARLKRWFASIQGPIGNHPPEAARPPFPGFEAVFGIPWPAQPTLEVEVPEGELQACLHLTDSYQRVFKTVDLYASRVLAALREDEARPDVWFIVIPDAVYQLCRPKSRVPFDHRVEVSKGMSRARATFLRTQPSLFEEENLAAIPYLYELNFHNQLKARLLGRDCPTQIVRESTIAFAEVLNTSGHPLRDLEGMESAIAWNLATAAFYKAGGRPWKIAAIRDGVCYVGLVFKLDTNARDARTACCAAQMFLDSGDGVVFKGAVGPWYNPDQGDYHLDAAAAQSLVELAAKSYKQKTGTNPRELFLHGRVRFTNVEWNGFSAGAPPNTELVGVRIRSTTELKLFRKGTHAILRGLAYVRDPRFAYLWTKGFVARLLTYPGREVPNPLLVDVCRGEAPIETVLSDIMALTKLNYNTCTFADGDPVTLRFANAVGEILTAGPIPVAPPLPFRYYI